MKKDLLMDELGKRVDAINSSQGVDDRKIALEKLAAFVGGAVQVYRKAILE